MFVINFRDKGRNSRLYVEYLDMKMKCIEDTYK